MKEKDEHTRQLNDVKSQLYQIKILLLVLTALCLLGFYGISRAMWDDVEGIISNIFEVLMVGAFLISPVILIVWARAIVSLSKTTPRIDGGVAATERTQ